MRLLLDTHTFLWWANSPEKLSQTALDACQDPNSELILSVASAWEMQIKLQLGKLQLTSSLEALIASQRHTNGLQILPVTLSHVLELSALPATHKDPFDRLLIAQARSETLLLVSGDGVFADYPVNVLW